MKHLLLAIFIGLFSLPSFASSSDSSSAASDSIYGKWVKTNGDTISVFRIAMADVSAGIKGYYFSLVNKKTGDTMYNEYGEWRNDFSSGRRQIETKLEKSTSGSSRAPVKAYISMGDKNSLTLLLPNGFPIFSGTRGE
jgi:hypothetical protein